MLVHFFPLVTDNSDILELVMCRKCLFDVEKVPSRVSAFSAPADTHPSALSNPLTFSLDRTLVPPAPARPAQPTHTHFDRSETPSTLQVTASLSRNFADPSPNLSMPNSLITVYSFPSLRIAPACSQLLLAALLYVLRL